MTVVVPTFNYGCYIRETLESVMEQTYQDWECIVVDDGSTDNTNEIVRHYLEKDSRFKSIRQRNRGTSAAKNAGIGKSRGEYLQFLDADDLIEPEKLAWQVGYLERHPEIDIVYGSTRYFGVTSGHSPATSVDSRARLPEVSGTGEEILIALVRGNIMPINAPLMRAEVVASVGSFDESMSHLEDWDYWIRCALRGRRFQHAKCSRPLALVRLHTGSASTSHHRMFEASLWLRRKIDPLIHDEDVRMLNRDLLLECEAWLDRLRQVREDLGQAIPSGHSFILVDDEELRADLDLEGRTVLPFLERGGEYWGHPPDGSSAVQELERMRREGATFMAFTQSAFWWLDYYAELRGHLQSRCPRVLATNRLLVFDITPTCRTEMIRALSYKC